MTREEAEQWLTANVKDLFHKGKLKDALQRFKKTYGISFDLTRLNTKKKIEPKDMWDGKPL